MRKKIAEDFVLDRLQEAYPRQMTNVQLMRDSGFTSDAINSALSRLAKVGRIERVEIGRYRWKPDCRSEAVAEQGPPFEVGQRSESTAEGRAVAAFHFEGYDVRIVNRDGTPWDRDGGLKPHWVLVDVCRAVGIENTSMVASRLDADEKYGVSIADAIGRQQPTTIVTRPGLTKVLRESRKPEAKAAADRFDRWVRHEVLEQVYETGSYVHPGAVPSSDSVLATVLERMDAARREDAERSERRHREMMQFMAESYKQMAGMLMSVRDSAPLVPATADNVRTLAPAMFEGLMFGLRKAPRHTVKRQNAAARRLADPMCVPGGEGGFTRHKLAKALVWMKAVTGALSRGRSRHGSGNGRSRLRKLVRDDDR